MNIDPETVNMIAAELLKQSSISIARSGKNKTIGERGSIDRASTIVEMVELIDKRFALSPALKIKLEKEKTDLNPKRRRLTTVLQLDEETVARVVNSNIGDLVISIQEALPVDIVTSWFNGMSELVSTGIDTSLVEARFIHWQLWEIGCHLRLPSCAIVLDLYQRRIAKKEPLETEWQAAESATKEASAMFSKSKLGEVLMFCDESVAWVAMHACTDRKRSGKRRTAEAARAIGAPCMVNRQAVALERILRLPV